MVESLRADALSLAHSATHAEETSTKVFAINPGDKQEFEHTGRE